MSKFSFEKKNSQKRSTPRSNPFGGNTTQTRPFSGGTTTQGGPFGSNISFKVQFGSASRESSSNASSSNASSSNASSGVKKAKNRVITIDKMLRTCDETSFDKYVDVCKRMKRIIQMKESLRNNLKSMYEDHMENIMECRSQTENNGVMDNDVYEEICSTNEKVNDILQSLLDVLANHSLD